jgi:hypothetical protein
MLLEPALELADWHEPATATADDAQLREDVEVEEVTAHTERLGSLGDLER